MTTDKPRRGGLLDDMAVMLAGAATLMSDETATCGQAEAWCRLAAELLAQYDRRRDECKPRPVERTTMHCLTCGCPCDGPCEEGDEQFRQESQPRPVERCSRPEATRYKAALEQLFADAREVLTWDGHLPRPLLLGISHSHAKHIERIARRALALGGEET